MQDFVRFEGAIRGVDEILECHLVSGGYDSPLYWLNLGLIARNAVSVPVEGCG